MSAALARLVLCSLLCMWMRECSCDAAKERGREREKEMRCTADDAEEKRAIAVARVKREAVSPRPQRRSRVEPRNGTEGRLHLLNWAQTRVLFFAPSLPAFHPLFTPRELQTRSSTPRLPHLPARLFHVRNSWPLLLPWNEVGMCKIVPRYALHHRVASSRVALFPPLAFFRASLYLYPPRSSISFLDLHP